MKPVSIISRLSHVGPIVRVSHVRDKAQRTTGALDRELYCGKFTKTGSIAKT